MLADPYFDEIADTWDAIGSQLVLPNVSENSFTTAVVSSEQEVPPPNVREGSAAASATLSPEQQYDSIMRDLESEICMWLPLDPPFVAPRRLLSRMSDVQRRRVQFQPSLPTCLSPPNQIVENDIIGGMCSEVKFLEKLFPLVHQLKSVRIERLHELPIYGGVSTSPPFEIHGESSTSYSASALGPSHAMSVSRLRRRLSVEGPLMGPNSFASPKSLPAGGAGRSKGSLSALVGGDGAGRGGPADQHRVSSGSAETATLPGTGDPSTSVENRAVLSSPHDRSADEGASVGPPLADDADRQGSGRAGALKTSPFSTIGGVGGSASFVGGHLQGGFVHDAPPLNIGVVCLGRESPGIHNTVWGLFDYLQQTEEAADLARLEHGGSMPAPSPDGTNNGNGNKPRRNRLFGFLGGGLGLLRKLYTEITEPVLAPYCNQAGLDLLQRSDYSVTESETQMLQVLETCNSLELDGLVIIGGASAHPDTALLAEYFLERQARVRVIGIPASVENDLPFVDQALGYDTACRVFSSIIGNLGAHAATSKKVWYFIRVAGRSVSHMASECAMQTHPNLIVLSEEVSAHHLGLADITNLLCDVIEARAELGLNYGVVLVPDGLLSRIPEMRQLLDEVNQIHKSGVTSDLTHYLTPLSQGVFVNLPDQIQYQIRMFVSPANEVHRFRYVDMTNIEAETLLKGLVESELSRRKGVGLFRGGGFSAKTHSLSYQSRSALPTNFDCNLGYTMGYGAAVLVDGGFTGLLVNVEKTKEPVENWQLSGVLLTSVITIKETNIGIKRTENAQRSYSVFVEPTGLLLSGESVFSHNMPPPAQRQPINPGPVQFDGPLSLKQSCRLIGLIDRNEKLVKVSKLCKELKLLASASCRTPALDAICASLTSSLQIVQAVKANNT